MINFKIVLYLLFFIFKISSSQHGVITLPFSKETPNLEGISPNDIIFPNLINNLILAELSLGTSAQKIKLRIEFESYIFYIAGKGSSSTINFAQENSKTYQKILEKELDINASKLNKAIYSSDYFYFNNKKYIVSFLLGINTDEDNSGGLIGLNLDDKNDMINYDKYNFLNELKRIGLINDYYFTIKYENNKSGKIIIGDLPHNYDKNYNKDNYKDIYSEISEMDLTWKIKFNGIYMGENENAEIKTNIEDYAYGYFRLEKNIIEGTEKYRKELLNSFMQEKINNNLCFEIKSRVYYNYYCKKEVDLSKMNNIYFYNKGLDFTFELTYKDLFYYNHLDGNNYFLVVFSTEIDEEDQDQEIDYNNYWILGEPFFRKYQFYFNKNSKRIGIYTSFNKSEGKKQSWASRNKGYIILVILLIMLLCGLGVMLFLFLNRQPKRKKKANELDDEFDYSSKKSNKLVNEE